MEGLSVLPSEPVLRDSIVRAERWPLSSPVTLKSDVHSGFVFPRTSGERSMRMQRKTSTLTITALVIVETGHHVYICGEDAAKPDQAPLLLALMPGEIDITQGERALRLITSLKTVTLSETQPAVQPRRNRAPEAQTDSDQASGASKDPAQPTATRQTTPKPRKSKQAAPAPTPEPNADTLDHPLPDHPLPDEPLPGAAQDEQPQADQPQDDQPQAEQPQAEQPTPINDVIDPEWLDQ